jgi:hypothetical protein
MQYLEAEEDPDELLYFTLENSNPDQAARRHTIRTLLENGASIPRRVDPIDLLQQFVWETDEEVLHLFREHWPQLDIDLDDDAHGGRSHILWCGRHCVPIIAQALAWGANPLYQIQPENQTPREKIIEESLRSPMVRFHGRTEILHMLSDAEDRARQALRGAALHIRRARHASSSGTDPSLPDEIRLRIARTAIP